MSDHPVDLVRDRAAFSDLLRQLRREPVIGVDTEGASFHRYHDRIYLLQLSSRARTTIVDPLSTGGLGDLGALLLEPGIEFVFHDADNDLRTLHREYGLEFRRVFDTRIAAQFAGEPAVGLAALLQRHFGVVTDKRLQRADWSARPLSASMIEYAATDTRFLPALRDLLEAELIRLGRGAWVAEECDLLTSMPRATRTPLEEEFLSIKGCQALDRRGLAVLRELYHWREATAAQADRASFRVLGNATLLALAANAPRSPEALARLSGFPRGFSPERIDQVLAAIERGLLIPEHEVPRRVRPRRNRPDQAYEARLRRLKAARAGLAAELQLPPGVVCPNSTLEAIARDRPQGIPALLHVTGVRQWQADAFGIQLLAAAADED
jgi:ribonuclease D